MQISIPEPKRIGLGILAGISTGLFWGFPFLVPQMVPHFSPLEIAFGRFFFFGLLSLVFLPKVIPIFQKLSSKERLQVFGLSAAGFWFYSILLFYGVQKTDGIIASLLVGLLPITIPFLSPERKFGGFRFYTGLGCLFFGLLNLFVFPMIQAGSELKAPSLSGVVSLVASLSLWTGFAFQNSKFLKAHPEIKRSDFASLIGVVSLVCMLPIFLLQVDFSSFINREGFSLYLWGSMILGFGSSWIANWLWNICSFYCPPEISGPLIVSETIFGLIYSFIFEKRFPHVFECASISLFIVGVVLTLSSQFRKDLCYPKIKPN